MKISLLFLSAVLGILLIVIFWPYIVMMINIMTLLICASIILIIIIGFIFILLHFILIPYYGIKNPVRIERGEYRIEQAKEVGGNDENKKI